ncbi:MAG TPA: HD domain-containing protein [Ilumatobacter sp.]|nr:HD domain-containing protein [Ilumatobacter sp.]
MGSEPTFVSRTEPGDGAPYPQAGRDRVIAPSAVAQLGTDEQSAPAELLATVGDDRVFMMGDNPRLARMPAEPTLFDFLRLRVNDFDRNHLLRSAALALRAGHPDKVVMACLLHDIAVGALLRADHGYWAAQLVGPYVDDEVAWAIRYHQALRYFPDESVGYDYPAAYEHYFGADFEPPEYLHRDADEARRHRWYMTSRLITLYDVYAFDDSAEVALDDFTDIVGRTFRQPREGLGFDGSPVAHMWRTMIWPNNFL